MQSFPSFPTSLTINTSTQPYRLWGILLLRITVRILGMGLVQMTALTEFICRSCASPNNSEAIDWDSTQQMVMVPLLALLTSNRSVTIDLIRLLIYEKDFPVHGNSQAKCCMKRIV